MEINVTSNNLAKKVEHYIYSTMSKIIFYKMLPAGTLTTSVTVYELLAVLTSRIDIQQKIHKEIDENIGCR